MNNNKNLPVKGEKIIKIKGGKDYMINDCSRFKTSLYKFLMSDSVYIDDCIKKNIKNKDKREYYTMKKIGQVTNALTEKHIALLIGIENILMTCEENISLDGTIYLQRSDITRLFGKNFRGERIDSLKKLLIDMSEIIVKVEIFQGEKNLDTGEMTEKKIGKIEENLLNFGFYESSNIWYISIKAPFIMELMKRKTRNKFKSIELMKFTFKDPKKILIAEYLGNVIYYHIGSNGDVPKKISIKSILESLNLYEEYSSMPYRDCNLRLSTLLKHIEVAASMIRNVSRVELPEKLTKSKIDDENITLYFKKKIELA